MPKPRFLSWTTALVAAAIGSLATWLRLESGRLDEIARAAEHAEV